MSSLHLPLAFNLGPTELIIILLIVLLLFGAKRLPELAKGLGKSINEFKKASSEAEQEVKSVVESKPDETRKTGAGGSAPGAN
ncbi:MAG: preprotein translocase subunit TatA [Verrucomicrobia bacterium RIFCSPLOWO2_12_FULL_64_8]|nr:MAG: preprotein translocase subunit TatA [Verrucomicrobia bacterium RIFCSPLOWO2_12_FULL_64_8]